jgi:hypothetical protein
MAIADLYAQMYAHTSFALVDIMPGDENVGVVHNELSFDGSAIHQEVVTFSFEQIPLTSTPATLAETEFTNDTDAQSTETFANTKSTTATQQFSITDGYKIGVDVEFHVGLPIVGGSVRGQYEVSFSKTETQTTSETESWTWSTTVNVPARSRVVVSIILQQANYSPKFSARMRVSGVASWVFHSNVLNHSPRSDVSIGKHFAHYPYPGVVVIDDSTIEFDVNGQLVGSHGLRTSVIAKQYKIDTGELVGVTSSN